VDILKEPSVEKDIVDLLHQLLVHLHTSPVY